MTTEPEALTTATRRLKNALATAQGPLERARVLVEWSETSLRGGRAAEAAGLADKALAELGEPASAAPPEPAPRGFLGLGGRGAASAAVPTPAAATPAAGEAERFEAAAAALEAAAASWAVLGDAERAGHALRRALERAARLGPGLRYLRLLGARALALAERRERAAAAEHLDALHRAAEAAPAPAAALARRFESLALLELGRPLEARAAAKAAREAAEQAGDDALRLEAALAAARAAAFAGEPAEAEAAAAAAREVAKRLGGNRAAELSADAIQGFARALAGDPAAGRRLLDGARSGAAAARLAAVDRVADGLAALLRSIAPPSPAPFAAIGDAIRAHEEAVARAAADLAAAEGLPAFAARARRVAATLAAERNEPGALALLERALGEARAAAGPVETALALLSLGEHGVRLEGRDPLPLYHEAETLAAAAGAALVRDRARAAREAHGKESADDPARERRELASLLEVGRALSSILELDPLLERIMDEVIALLGADRGFVMLYARPRPLTEPAPPGAALEVRVARNLDREKLSSEEFRVSRSVVATVERTGEPVLVRDAAHDERYGAAASIQDLRLRSILCFPLRTTRSLLGVAYADSRSAERLFRPRDQEAMLPFFSQAAQAIENAFAFERIRELYEETLSVARTREKVIQHLSHELGTPLALVRGALHALGKTAGEAPSARRALDRGERTLARLGEVQRTIAEIAGASGRRGPAEDDPAERIALAPLLEAAVARARAAAPARELEIAVLASAAPAAEVDAPRRALETVLESLLKNAIEATPDEGRIEVVAAEGALEVRDSGVGIVPESRPRIFDGFFHARDAEDYGSKEPYAFAAGGKGLELLRAKVLAERHGWTLTFESRRCGFIPREADPCPGRITLCAHCPAGRADCLASGGTTFRLAF